MIRTKGEPGTGNVVEAVRHMRAMTDGIAWVRGLRPEQLALLVADTAGPLRAAAATLLDLEGKPFDSPKDALAKIAASFDDPAFAEALAAVSEARETRSLDPGKSERAVFEILALARRLFERAKALA